ncbi:hypothetical protein IGI04_016397 [Brassica rapa subsp. trilocularis]|uniref:Uncharacterized protein n=1 Tax=Brassica rapa subsp. trilocularis TaxID=1813537 RepID=A0ABQ7MSV2_BRACM|nr:hypothetical protein IGI04_016397 [Brassica rapa subsp. trilocularis]
MQEDDLIKINREILDILENTIDLFDLTLASDSATREEATFSMIWEPDGEVVDRSFVKCHAIPGQFEEASHAASTKQEGVDGGVCVLLAGLRFETAD